MFFSGSMEGVGNVCIRTNTEVIIHNNGNGIDISSDDTNRLTLKDVLFDSNKMSAVNMDLALKTNKYYERTNGIYIRITCYKRSSSVADAPRLETGRTSSILPRVCVRLFSGSAVVL